MSKTRKRGRTKKPSEGLPYLGQLVKKHRKSAGLSQEAAGKLIGLTQNNFSPHEAGTEPGRKFTAEKLKPLIEPLRLPRDLRKLIDSPAVIDLLANYTEAQIEAAYHIMRENPL